jgi:hypothetical protein
MQLYKLEFWEKSDVMRKFMYFHFKHIREGFEAPTNEL